MCLVEPLSVTPKMDLAKAEATSDGGSASGIAQLKTVRA